MKTQNHSILKIKNLSMHFGGLVAVDKFNLDLFQNQLVGVIGPNGAGKTTLFNMITGIYPPTYGEIFLENKPIHNFSVSKIAQLGVARTFQNIRLFKDLTVLDNIKLASHYKTKYNLFQSIFRTSKFHKEEARVLQEANSLLEIFKLDDKKNYLAKNLPYGDQRRLEIARALATKPELLLLDEPAAGMNPQETNELTNLITWVRKHFKVTILLIEHDMKLVMNLCEKIVVIDHGELIAEGTPSEIQANPKVISAYLGSDEEIQ